MVGRFCVHLRLFYIFFAATLHVQPWPALLAVYKVQRRCTCVKHNVLVQTTVNKSKDISLHSSKRRFCTYTPTCFTNVAGAEKIVHPHTFAPHDVTLFRTEEMYNPGLISLTVYLVNLRCKGCTHGKRRSTQVVHFHDPKKSV